MIIDHWGNQQEPMYDWDEMYRERKQIIPKIIWTCPRLLNHFMHNITEVQFHQTLGMTDKEYTRGLYHFLMRFPALSIVRYYDGRLRHIFTTNEICEKLRAALEGGE